MVNLSANQIILPLLCIFELLTQYLVGAKVTALNTENVDTVINSAEVVFVNFYADWCRFSQMLTPIYEEASNKFDNEPAGRVVWASLDCDRYPEIAQRYHISKYPTLKMFRSGQVAKREFRGQRSVDSLAEFISKQLATPMKTIAKPEDLVTDPKKRTTVGYFTAANGPAYDNFMKVASNLREDCEFVVGAGPEFQGALTGQPNGYKLTFKGPEAPEEQLFSGDMTNLNYLSEWITDKCIPLVREITFENAEELTEEGLPFLILFRKPEDTEILDKFSTEVIRQLSDLRSTVNCLVADGRKFAHPLHHLGKAESDLPVIAIDSFRHMYLFPDASQMSDGDKLRQFILDLHSGKLHREFHHGPDPTQVPTDNAHPVQKYKNDGSALHPNLRTTSTVATTTTEEATTNNGTWEENLRDKRRKMRDVANDTISNNTNNNNNNATDTNPDQGQPQDPQQPEPINPDPQRAAPPAIPAGQGTDPPESVFKKLKPSNTRYTILDFKDEL